VGELRDCGRRPLAEAVGGRLQAAAWGGNRGSRSIKLTILHCHGRTHVYALCRTLVVDQLVCFSSTEANRHGDLCAAEYCSVCTRKRQQVRNGWLRRMGRAMSMSTNVFGLANRFPGWRLLRSSKALAVRANARGAAEHGEDGDWVQRT
jgi:hypothetical protein